MEFKPNYEEEKFEHLISRLREEGNFVKDCFTKFSFQGFAFSTVMIGLVAKFQGDCPYIGFASLLIIMLNLAIINIGLYKYATANRNFGYELHINRIKTLSKDSTDPKVLDPYMKIGWEEAMRAWRIIQPTVYEYLYNKKLCKINILRTEHKKQKHRWFEPTTNICEDVSTYFAGGYLRTMLYILFFIAAIAILPLIIMDMQFFSKFFNKVDVEALMAKEGWKDYIRIQYFWYLLTGGITTLLAIYTVIRGLIKCTAKRRLLENGLLSIHSCGILWQVVVVAHYRALKKSKEHNGNKTTYRKYTNYLSKEVDNICRYIFDIHYWIENPDNPMKKGSPCNKLKWSLKDLKENAASNTLTGRFKVFFK